MTAADPSTSRAVRWRYRRSLAGRVTLLTTVAVALAVAFVALGAYLTVRIQLQSTLDDSLLRRAQQAASTPVLTDLTSSFQISTAALGAGDVRIGVLDVNQESLRLFDYGPSLSIGPEAPEVAVAQGRAETSVRTVSSVTGEKFRVAAVPLADPGRAMIILQSLDSQDRVLARLGLVMLLFGALGVAVAGAAGWGVARNGLRPVRRLTGTVEGIARTEDLTPLPVEGDDEVARLASAFNQMLTALAASRDRQRQLVADAGHELRTPLTSLRTNLDLLRQAEQSTNGPTLSKQMRHELLSDVDAQTAELTTLIGDLVQLARDDGVAPVVEAVDLAAVVEASVARVRLRAPGLRFEVSTDPWWLVGDGAALERAVTNLLDNAAKWSPPGAAVTVQLVDGVLCVDDVGPGIAAHDQPHVFERFWRSEESRSMPGSGLGLAIVHQTADRHAGSVEVTDSPYGGARLVLRLPGSPDPVNPGRPAGPALAGAARPSSGSRRTPPAVRSGP